MFKKLAKSGTDLQVPADHGTLQQDTHQVRNTTQVHHSQSEQNPRDVNATFQTKQETWKMEDALHECLGIPEGDEAGNKGFQGDKADENDPQGKDPEEQIPPQGEEQTAPTVPHNEGQTKNRGTDNFQKVSSVPLLVTVKL